jgi:HPr kinase/phosphorylase
MTELVTTRTLFEALSDRLKLKWVAGESGGQSPLRRDLAETHRQPPVGHLNCIHPNRIQVIGHAELLYLTELTDASYQETIDKLFAARPAAILFSDGVEVEGDFIRKAEEHRTPLLSSPLDDNQLVSDLHYYFTHALAERLTVHGVFLEVMGMGVLLTGDASVGKSELALELITRGHRLIADDAPEFAHIAPDILLGTCPPLLREFLEVRGLGILNIRAMFGDSVIKQKKYLRLIIHLQKMSDTELARMNRLEGSHTQARLLGVSIPKITVPVASGRNLAILVESAVRLHILSLKGYDARQIFVDRQLRMIAKAERQG